jgi:hypothetical protein
MKTPTPFEIIQRLGGRDVVAIAAEVTPTAVSQWYDDGIPWKRHRALLALAKERGVRLTRIELEQARFSDRIVGERRRGRAVDHLAMAS